MKHVLLTILVLFCGCKGILLEVQQESDLAVERKIDPWELELTLGAKGAYAEAKFPGSPHIVPKIDIDLMASEEFGKMNSYEVQRCVADRSLSNSVGEDPTQINYRSDYMAQEDYLYVWGKAAAGTCTLLRGTHTSSPFIDLIAPQAGNFFYILRPCLKADRSIYGGKRRCSYKFTKTDVVEYKDTLYIADRRMLSLLSDYSFELQFLFSHMADTIRAKARYLQKCEFNEAHRIVAERRLAGIIKVSLTAVSVVTAAIISGPQNAFIAGSTAARLGDKLFSGISNAVLNCPTYDYDNDLEDTQERVEQVIASIGSIRVALNEIKLAEVEEAPPLAALEEAQARAGGF